MVTCLTLCRRPMALASAPSKRLALPQHSAMLALTRGGHPENVVYGSAAVVDANGRVRATIGDAATPVFARSTLKPFQAMPLLAGFGRELGLSDADVAVLCASHNGEAAHVTRVQALLRQAGATEADLRCGTQTPAYYAATGQRPEPGATFHACHHGCSGNHAGLMLLAHAMGHPVRGYEQAQHPAQQAALASVAHFTNQTPARLIAAIDGCNLPTYAMPLTALARAYAQLTPDQPDATYGQAPAWVWQGMTQHPALVSGLARHDLVLTRAGQGDWLAKEGADGLQMLASRQRQLAIAVKVADGQATHAMRVMVAVLDQLEWLNDHARHQLRPWLQSEVRNSSARAVGQWQPVLSWFGLG